MPEPDAVARMLGALSLNVILMEPTLMANVKEQLKLIIIRSLRIEDMTPEDLRDDQPLLGGELEIDSIDILQLILEIERHFNIKLVDNEFDESEWESIDRLAATIEARIAART